MIETAYRKRLLGRANNVLRDLGAVIEFTAPVKDDARPLSYLPATLGKHQRSTLVKRKGRRGAKQSAALFQDHDWPLGFGKPGSSGAID